MSRIEVLEERCKGCLLCTLVCPKKIVVQACHFNKQGYKPATVSDMEKCTGCTSCALICPDAAIRVYKPIEADKPKRKEAAA